MSEEIEFEHNWYINDRGDVEQTDGRTDGRTNPNYSMILTFFFCKIPLFNQDFDNKLGKLGFPPKT